MHQFELGWCWSLASLASDWPAVLDGLTGVVNDYQRGTTMYCCCLHWLPLWSQGARPSILQTRMEYAQDLSICRLGGMYSYYMAPPNLIFSSVGEGSGTAHQPQPSPKRGRPPVWTKKPIHKTGSGSCIHTLEEKKRERAEWACNFSFSTFQKCGIHVHAYLISSSRRVPEWADDDLSLARIRGPTSLLSTCRSLFVHMLFPSNCSSPIQFFLISSCRLLFETCY